MLPHLCCMTQDSVQAAAMIFIFGLWRAVYIHHRRVSRNKAEVLSSSVTKQYIKAFTHWRIFMVDHYARVAQETMHSLILEKRMLGVEMDDVEQKKVQIGKDLNSSNEFLTQSERRLADEAAKCASLALQMELARPALVRSTLCSTLNIMFAGSVYEAQLCRFLAHRYLNNQEIGVLKNSEDELLRQFTSLQAEDLLIRWVNYHLLACKMTAADIIGSLSQLRNDDFPGNCMRRNGEFSARDEGLYTHRCRIVRGIHKVDNLSEDLRDGIVLTVLYAAISSMSHGQGQMSPVMLWPLDERNLELRANTLCDALRRILPTHAAQSLLKPADIVQGNAPVLTVMLATLFLHFPNLPLSVPESQIHKYIGAVPRSSIPTDTPQEESGCVPDQTTQDIKDGDAVAGFALRLSEARVQSPSDSMSDDSHTRTLEDEVTHHAIELTERASHGCGYDSLQDLAVLLRGTEILSDLEFLPVSELLLRWVNFKLHRLRDNPIHEFAELKGGRELMELLLSVAHDVVSLVPDARKLPEMRVNFQGTGGQHSAIEVPPKDMKQLRIQIILDVASRCTTFDILTESAINKGEDDIIAAFLAGLFLNRPGLPVSPTSALHRGIKHIEAVLHKGTTSKWATCAHCGAAFIDDARACKDCGHTGVDRGGAACSGFSKFCMFLLEQHADFSEALSAVQEARDLHKKTQRRLQTFLGELLAQRARGTPSSLDPTQGSLESHRWQLLSGDRLLKVVSREARSFHESQVTDCVTDVEVFLRKYSTTLCQIFLHYSGADRMQLEGHHWHNAQSGNHAHHKRYHGHGGHHSGRNLFSDRRCSRSAAARATKLVSDGKLNLDLHMGGTSFVPVVDLRTLVSIFKECRLRASGLTTGDIEEIYYLVLAQKPRHVTFWAETVSSQATGLLLEDFVEALLVIAFRWREDRLSVMERLNLLAERYLLPNACRQRNDLFCSFAEDPSVRPVFHRFDMELRAIYNAYCVIGKTDTPEEMEKAVAAFAENPFRESYRMPCAGFETLLRHAGLLTGTLDVAAIRSIFNGSQGIEDKGEPDFSERRLSWSCRRSIFMIHEDEEMPETLETLVDKPDGEDSFFFPDFECALLVVLLYKDPNPFVALPLRFETFVKDRILAPLRAHWLQQTQDTNAFLGSALEGVLGERGKQASPFSPKRQTPRLLLRDARAAADLATPAEHRRNPRRKDRKVDPAVSASEDLAGTRPHTNKQKKSQGRYASYNVEDARAHSPSDSTSSHSPSGSVSP